MTPFLGSLYRLTNVSIETLVFLRYRVWIIPILQYQKYLLLPPLIIFFNSFIHTVSPIL